MTNVDYQAPPAAKRPRPVFRAVLRSVLAAMVPVVLYYAPPLDRRWGSGPALGLVLPWYLLLAFTCSLVERTSPANFTRPLTAARPPGDVLPARWAPRQPVRS